SLSSLLFNLQQPLSSVRDLGSCRCRRRSDSSQGQRYERSTKEGVGTRVDTLGQGAAAADPTLASHGFPGVS
ncbi:hypothetical protein LINPERHAP2_LOCUS18892, partial [Linum perenne]